MPNETVKPAVRDCMNQIVALVAKANGLATAAKNCCEAGDYDAGFRIALEFEPYLHDANSLISAVSTLRRCSASSP